MPLVHPGCTATGATRYPQAKPVPATWATRGLGTSWGTRRRDGERAGGEVVGKRGGGGADTTLHTHRRPVYCTQFLAATLLAMDRGANARMVRADRPARHVRPASHPWEGRTWVGRAAPPCSCLSVRHDRIEEIGSLDRLAGDARHPRPTAIHPLSTAGRSPSLGRIWRLAAAASECTSAGRRTSAASAQGQAGRQADGYPGLALAELLVANRWGAGVGSAARTGAAPSFCGGISASAGSSAACCRHTPRSACQAGQPAAADVRAADAGGTRPPRECWHGRCAHRRSPD